MKIITFTTSLILLLLTACTTQNFETSSKQATNTQKEGLVAAKSRFFDEMYLQKKEKLTALRDIYIADLHMEDVILKEPSSSFGKKSEWSLEPEDRVWLNSRYKESMFKAINATEKYRLVNEPGSDTMLIQAQLIELAPNAPKDNSKNRNIFAEYYTEGTGDLTIGIKVNHLDETLLLVVDEREAGSTWQRNNSNQSQNNIILVFNGWSKDLMKQLELIK